MPGRFDLITSLEQANTPCSHLHCSGHYIYRWYCCHKQGPSIFLITYFPLNTNKSWQVCCMPLIRMRMQTLLQQWLWAACSSDTSAVPRWLGTCICNFSVYSKYIKSTQVEILIWFFFLIVSPNPLYLNLWKPALQKKCHPQWMKFKISQCQIRTNNLSKQKANLTICWVNLCRGKIV